MTEKFKPEMYRRKDTYMMEVAEANMKYDKTVGCALQWQWRQRRLGMMAAIAEMQNYNGTGKGAAKWWKHQRDNKKIRSGAWKTDTAAVPWLWKHRQ